MIRGVVFDVDDTLYLERDYVSSGFEAVGEHIRHEYGVEGFSEVAWRLFVEGRRGDTFDRALELVGLEGGAVAVSRLVRIYREHAPNIQLLDDSQEVLGRLDDRNVPVAIITDGPASSQHAKVDALGLREGAAAIVVTADLGPGKGKPHEAAFLRVQRQLDLSGDQLVYVADNPTKDFIAPRRLGWRTVRVRRSGSLHEDLASGTDVDREVRGLGEVSLL